MEGSSESGWEGSDSSRGLNSSALVDRNPRFQISSIRSSGDVSHDTGFVPGRKGRGRIESPHVNCLKAQGGVTEDRLAVDRGDRRIDCSDVSLRQWLDDPERAVDALECLHIFSQIVEIVNLAHSQGIVVHNARPSCFVMSSFKRIAFIESASCSDSGSDSSEDGLNSQTIELKDSSSVLPHESDELGRQSSQLEKICTKASVKVSESHCLQSSSGHVVQTKKKGQEEEKKHTFPMKQILLMETNWYSSPEEIAGAPSCCASDIYRLGVLLFELFCTFSSPEEKSATMHSLRHRVLPPQLLLKWPKEASFCLWLLHPEPSSRPKMGELLESEFLNAPRDEFEEREAAIELREKIEEQELLLEFLLLCQQRKQEAKHNLHEIVSFLSSDIEEVSKMQKTLRVKGGSNQEPVKDLDSGKINITENDDAGSSGSRKRYRPGLSIRTTEESDDNLDERQKSEKHVENKGSTLAKNSRLMNNFRKLEAAYFMTRHRVIKPTGKPSSRHSQVSADCRTSVVATERISVSNLSSKEGCNEDRQSGSISSFLEGLCKYLSYSKLEVKADLKQGDLLNSSNLVCALSFDRDGEFFATAGVNKKIKVFEYNSIVNEDRDIRYPVVEMASRSKLSSICWNGYIKSQIASSNFEGVVQVWDVTRNQLFMEMREHERRVWSVDFSVADPTMLASGSDDGSVKLWNINQGVSIGTIKTKANVCCVQFPFDSGRSLAFGSADHKIYYYDLRNSKMPLCTLIGHNKTVSYVKFIDSTTLVSASTDNTLKLWDLSICSSRILDSPLQSFTGHMNVKNFVGLSISDGYIATGSETNEVFVYHKAFPMPALSFKFNSTDPLSGDEVDDQAQFISSVCWRGQSSTLVAANSMGNIKLLEMV
ncbi:protein SPA1-RELATED 4-like isoform X1 [Nicotiana tomentosiformis]|uniref:protein SPA1-RELATED 4-like isoform X1 n=1 Tax=Nicotiana tomentosiformis TaxID=4098 RepID=UPI00051B3274|nr:protein SPA1-RELATED 4-like isoform X1 [Nicotiana tomentosiformis]XP_009604689.1 protein SPA1-RELATED 4-like isoform X1 [Nicotiana tomentosiformis]XP_009604690.1 protein SPA1-RELATED 4-like isoform X1 [Nicotiana tomentosiformis]